MVAATPNLPSKQKGVIAGPNGEFVVSSDVPVVPLDPDYIIIKTKAVALNPVDTKLVGDFVTPGCAFGFDVAGVVVAIGSNVTRGWKVGDRVCGSAHGMNKDSPSGGGFVEYATLGADQALKIPDSMSFEEAAALGTAVATSALALFWSLGIDSKLLEKPAEKPFPVLIYGGSSSTGTMTIQLVKLCGLTAITTCSKKNFDLVKEFGADVVFDYTSPTCAEDIKKFTKNNLKYAVDCITQDSTIKICYSALGRAGGKYTALDPYPQEGATRKVVKPDWVLATRISGRGSHWPEPFQSPPEPAYLDFAKPVYAALQKHLDNGNIRPHKARVSDGGFEDIINGVNLIRQKQVSGEKLVYTVSA